MEIALDPKIPTYAGGLGVLAGDMIRSAADMKVPMVVVSLLHRKGYFRQRLEADGWQREEPIDWPVEKCLKEMPQRSFVIIEGRTIQLRAWRYQVKGVSGAVVPVYLLDTDLPANAEWDRSLTHYLYGGDARYRLCQEAVLGIGGVRMLRVLGHEQLRRFHMNEGHAGLLTVALLDEQAQRSGRTAVSREDVEAVRALCVFTTHTPVPAGHDKFPLELVSRVLNRPDLLAMDKVFTWDGMLNMTHLGLNFSHYVNGVAKKHGEVSREMFARETIDAITNGVHAATWASPPFQALFDRYLPDWRQDNFSLRNALGIPREEIWQAHRSAKEALLACVNQRAGGGFEADVFTLGFARRAAAYKRGDLLFSDLERLKQVIARAGAIQIVYAGKAHPNDQEAKELIRRIFKANESLKGAARLVYLENHDMELAKLLTAGVDVWLNTPKPPLEASGTSGMKAALNGVPSLSVLDGWWIEGHIEGVTGWSVGEPAQPKDDGERNGRDAAALYEKLELAVLPLFYRERDRFVDVMRSAIALNGSFFNTQRMLQEYVVDAYLR
ncbi:MAG: alpha-glucan family phosphorylase [Candidatus Omnitrophica bacterium]|nr:alpha-glucan family phosphorylase [Candidatus Omnitrophota bacterium]